MTNNKRLHYNEQKLADQDYKSKLNSEQKEWLAQFNKEYYQGIYNENDREIHPEEFDQDLKSNRSSRRKDVFGNQHVDIETIEFQEVEEEEVIEIEMLCKIDEKQALNILRMQAQDMIANEIESLENILTDLQRDTIKIFMNARKNQ